MSDAQRRWPLVDDDDPHVQFIGYLALATGAYWFIAPLIVLAEVIAAAFTEIWEDRDA